MALVWPAVKLCCGAAGAATAPDMHEPWLHWLHTAAGLQAVPSAGLLLISSYKPAPSLPLQGNEKEAIVPALTGVFAEALRGGVSNLSFGELSGNLGEGSRVGGWVGPEQDPGGNYSLAGLGDTKRLHPHLCIPLPL